MEPQRIENVMGVFLLRFRVVIRVIVKYVYWKEKSEKRGESEFVVCS